MDSSADDLLARIELGLSQAAAAPTQEAREAMIRAELTLLHDWGKSSPEQAIAFANALAQSGADGGCACLALGQALMGAASGLGSAPLFQFGCEWNDVFDDQGEYNEELQATFSFSEDALMRAAGGALSLQAMEAMRAFSAHLEQDWCNYGSRDDIDTEARFEILARHFQQSIQRRASTSIWIRFDDDSAELEAARCALRTVSTQAALRREIPAAAAAPAARL